jgi:hsp70-interacting protein
MQSLLTWGIQNSTPESQEAVDRQKLNPDIIDMILGRPDSELMKEALTIAVDTNRSEDDKLEALDQFEMVSRAVA